MMEADDVSLTSRDVSLSSDVSLISSRRFAYNAMIQCRVNNFSEYLNEDVVQVTSSGMILTGLGNVTNDYVLDDYVNDAFIAYERLPDTIHVSSKGNQACERGHWRARFRGDSEGVEVGGTGLYHAEWRKVNDVWKIKAELYTRLD